MYVVRYYATGTDREPVREYIDAIRDKRERDDLSSRLRSWLPLGGWQKGSGSASYGMNCGKSR
jgi:hypothetical protein